MSFATKITALNKSKKYLFTNKGLIDGVLCRVTIGTGEKSYYTSDYRKFDQYKPAMIKQRQLNTIK